MTESSGRAAETSTAPQSAAAMLDRLNAIEEPPDASPPELKTGFSPLDEVLDGGLSVGDLCVIGGAPGVGKTIAALQMARNMAAAGHRVLYCCYEHDAATLLGRLVALEIGNLRSRVERHDDRVARSSVNAIMAGRWSAGHAGFENERVQAAMAQLDGYGDRLMLVQLSTAVGGLDDILERMTEPETPFRAVFVDYLQKIGVAGTVPGIERWTVAVEGLKDIALSQGCLIVAVSALDQEALSKRRVTLDGFRGAEAIAHEADVAIVINSKLKLVSRAHLAFDTTLQTGFARTQVFTVEKNRRGPAPVDMEFEKDFARFRFEGQGRYGAERLIDDILVKE